MTINNILKSEFSKDKLSKVNIHLLIKTYLEEEIKNNVTTENFKVFLGKSNFLSFFLEENFKNSPHRLVSDLNEDDGSVQIIDSGFWFEIEIENENENLTIQHGHESHYNQLTMIYTKIINGIAIRKHFLLERESNNTIDCFYLRISANNDLDLVSDLTEFKEFINYQFYFNKKIKKFDEPLDYKDSFKNDLSVKIKRNNYITEGDFDLLDLKYDFYDNEIKNTLVDFFSPENFDNIDYFKETHDLLDFVIENFEK